MIRPKSFAIRTLLLSLCAVLANCGGSSGPVITLSPSGTQMVDQGQSVTFMSNEPVMWTLMSLGTLTNMTATSVTYNAPAAVAAPAMDHLIATSVKDPKKSVTVEIDLAPPPSITSATALPAGTNATPYSQQVAASGGVGTLSFAVTAGALPAGLMMSSSGLISGKPTGSNVTANFTVTVTDQGAPPLTSMKALSIFVAPPPALVITSTSPLPGGTTNVAYNSMGAVATSGGIAPISFAITSGALPNGMTISASTGLIIGTPTNFGTFNFTVTATDSAIPPQTTSKAFSMTIMPPPVVITTTSLPNGVVNASYSATLQATGGAPPITWAVTTGALPGGLILNASTGAITGMPTAAGTITFTVTASDSSTPALTASKALSITIIPVLSITTTSLPNGVTGASYSATLASTGGVTPVGWSVTVGTLPGGLSLNPSTGAITGSPTTAGTTSFTVQASDSGTPQQKVTQALSITIIQALVITNPSLPTGAVNSTYSAMLTFSGGTPAVTWAISVGTLPGGLTLNTTTGAITGTPTAAGMSTFTVQATDSGTPQQVVTKQFTIPINPVLAITTTSLPSGTAGTFYSQTVVTNGGGVPPIAWSIILGSLPPGLSINAGTGVISGTPTTATGSPFSFTVQAADSGTPQQTATQALSISIATAPLSVATTSLPDGVIGQAYNTSLVSAGGNPPVTWAISVGSLPAGLMLNTSTGAITGMPTTAGTITFTVKATDSSTPSAQTASKQLSIRVNAVLTITTTSLPPGTVGTNYSATLMSSGGATPVTWSISVGSLPPGLGLNTSTGVISGTPTTATGSPFSFTVQVTDSTSPTPQTATQALSITVTVAPLMVTTTSGSLPPGTVNIGYPSTSLNASGGVPPYSWSVTGGALPNGMGLSGSGQLMGTPTATGTSTFTVTVTDSAMPANTATASLSITINAAPMCVAGGSESLLSGSYAILLKGFDNGTPSQPALVGGVLTFNGTTNSGMITAGALDMNLNAGVMTNLTVTSGTYGVGSDHRGCMVITTSAGTQNYRFSLGNISGTPAVASTGHVIEFDATGPFITGIMRKQSGSFSNTTLNGSYAFGVSSIQNTNVTNNGVAGGKFGAVGVITFSGNGGITGGSEDFNNNGQLDNLPSTTTAWPTTSPISISNASTYTVSSNGRGTLAISITGMTGTFNEFLYVVSSSESLIMTSDPQKTNTIVAGQALLQSSTSFSTNPLSGTLIGYQSQIGSAMGSSKTQLILISTSSGSSSVTGTLLKNDGGNLSMQSLTGLTYSVASSGRMTLSGAGAGTGPGPIFYLVSPNQIFLLNGSSSVGAGFFQSQIGSSFTNNSASGVYAFGAVDPEAGGSSVESGVANFASPNVSGTSDNISSGSQNVGKPFGPNAYSIDPTGLGLIPAGCTLTGATANCNTAFFVVSPTKAVVMDAKPTTPTNPQTNPKIEVADQ